MAEVKKTKETKEVVEKAAPKKAVKAGVFAVIETGGKQYKVQEGEYFKIEKLGDDMKEGDKIKFDKVLLVDDGKNTEIGDPYIKGRTVEAVLEEQGKGRKVMVIRFKSKSRYFRKKGHRQPYMQVKITKI